MTIYNPSDFGFSPELPASAYTLTPLAWVNGDDVKAVRTDDGSELLVVDGKPIPLTDDDVHPTQQVINYCHATKRQRRALRTAWLARTL